MARLDDGRLAAGGLECGGTVATFGRPTRPMSSLTGVSKTAHAEDRDQRNNSSPGIHRATSPFRGTEPEGRLNTTVGHRPNTRPVVSTDNNDRATIARRVAPVH